MKPGTPCIIEPGRDALEDEAHQLYGLIVVATRARDHRSWEVEPEAFVTYRHPTKSCRGTLTHPGKPVSVLIPVEWLRPLSGNTEPASTKQYEGAHA